MRKRQQILLSTLSPGKKVENGEDEVAWTRLTDGRKHGKENTNWILLRNVFWIRRLKRHRRTRQDGENMVRVVKTAIKSNF